MLPPQTPATYVERRAVLATLEITRHRRLTAVVAGPGYGKSTLVAAWARTQRATWYTLDSGDGDLSTLVSGLLGALRTRLPSLTRDLDSVAGTRGRGVDDATHADAIVDRLALALGQARRRPLVLVLDDLHVLAPGSAAARLVEGVCRQAPAWLHVVLCSREDPPFPIARLRGQGEVLDIDAAALTFDEGDTGALLAAVAGDGAAVHAGGVHELTGGWPAAVRLAVEALAGVPPRERTEALSRLRLPGGRLLHYLAEEVMARSDPEITRLVRAVAPFSRFRPGLCEALGVRVAPGLLADLARRGLFVEPRSSIDGWFSLHAVVREYALTHLPLEPGTAEAHLRAAATWLERNDHLADALDALAGTGDEVAISDFVARHGPALMARGAGSTLLSVARRLPTAFRTGAVAEVLGAAHHARGEWDAALSTLRRVAGPDEPLPAGTAWRMGLILHLRGELDEALAVYGRGAGAPDGADRALLLAWTAAAHWLRGEREPCAKHVEEAIVVAEACGDDRALAAAHTTLAMLAAVDGDRAANDAHYLRALDAAERSGDTLQLVRIRANRGSRFLEEGAYEEALTELDLAVQVAELTGFLALLGLALSNRAEVHLRQGRIDDAQADYEAAVSTFQRAASRLVSLPLAGLGDVHRERGQLVRARAAYREALSLARPDGDMQATVAALAGLARATAADDPEEAARLAGEAVARAAGPSQVKALLAAGWVALVRGDTSAATSAREAAARAAAQRDRPGLAEALVLSAIAASDHRVAARELDEAAALWREIASPLGAARTALVRAWLLGGRHAAAEAAHAEAQLRRLGVPLWSEISGGHARVHPAEPPAVAVCALGGFRVLRSGHPVPLAAWGSRKARDLLKMLVARRGRPVPREELFELLWPDEGNRDLGARLSVLLSTLRGVLDPDRASPPDRFVRADHAALSLDPEQVEVDVETFLAAAAEGLAYHDAGDAERALPLLAAADDLYRGDFLEEEPYADWAVALREEARARAIAVARGRARDASSAGDHDVAVSALLRVLARDPFDEGAHLALVRTLAGAGHHGEAHRRYRLYVERMAELEVEAAAFPPPGDLHLI